MSGVVRCWRVLAAAFVFSLGLACLAAAAEGDPPLSQIVADGIGKRFPPTGGPLNYDRWPIPLRDWPGAMMTAAISPDGTLVATGCGHSYQPGEVVLWDAATGRERWVRRYPRGIRSVAFTADGRRLAIGSFGGVACLIEVGDGKLVCEFRGHSDAINSLALSADDRWLATGSHDQTVILWNVADGTKVRTFEGHTADVLTVAISNSGQRLASAGRDNTVRIWNLETGETIHALAGHEQLVEMVAFSPDDAQVASASWDNTVRVWDVKSGAQRALLRRAARFTSLAFAPQGKQIWCGGFDGKVAVWDPAKAGPPREFQVQKGATYALALSADGSRIATCGFEGSARLWKPDGTLLQKFDRQPALTGEARRIVQAAWTSDEKRIATVHGDGVLRLTHAADGTVAGELRIEAERITCAAVANDGNVVFAGTDRGNVHRWNPDEKSRARASIATHATAVTALALSPDAALVASCSQDGSVEIHDRDRGKTLATFNTNSPPTSAVFDSSSKRVAIGRSDGRVGWWDATTGRQIGDDFGPAQPVRAMAVAQDSALAIAAGSSIELWDVALDEKSAKATRRRVLTIPDGEILQLAVAPRSRQLISGDSAGKVRLWGLSGGAARTLARTHQGGVTALAIAPASEVLVTAGADLAAWLWNPGAAEETIRPLASIPAHETGTRYVALAKEARLVSDGYDNHVRVWSLATGQMERDLGASSTASACVLLSDGAHVAVGRWDKRIQLFELATGDRLDNIRGLPRGPYAIALSPDGNRMAAVFRELGATVYDLKAIEADPVVTLPPDELPFTHVVFAPDGNAFVTCTGDYKRMEIAGKVRLHDAKTGAVIRSFDGHTSEVKLAAFDADGQRLATASGDKTVRVWDVASGKPLALMPHPTGTFVAAFVPQSDLIFTADYHGVVHVWDLTKTASVQQLPGHADMVSRLAFSDDLSVLATGSRDGTVKLWKLSGRGNELRIVDAHEADGREISEP